MTIASIDEQLKREQEKRADILRRVRSQARETLEVVRVVHEEAVKAGFNDKQAYELACYLSLEDWQ